jgi:hypothetical protein
MATISGAAIPAIWSEPKLGRILEPSLRRVESTWRKLLSSFQCLSHLAATFANEFSHESSSAVF